MMATITSNLLSSLQSFKHTSNAAIPTIIDLPSNKFKRRIRLHHYSLSYYVVVYLTIISLFNVFTKRNGVECHSVEGSCPQVCTCKWKGGKQTVECLDRQLINIPKGIDSSTQVLDMSGSNLQILPGETFRRAELLNLQKLYLRNCRLGLIELDLSHNLLTSVPAATFQYITSLRDLTLASNPIQKIESHAFSNILSLTKLDVSHCDLQSISASAFENLDSLHSLKLNGNKLSELRGRTVETLSKLHWVELHDNPWLCDCRMRATKLWLTENNIPYPVAPICSGGPERVIDKAFSELHVDDFACKPEMLPARRHVEAVSGDNATIICRTGAIPSATITWYWNGRLLINNTAFSSYQKVHIYEDGSFEKRSRLVLTNAQETDSSEFYCVAENKAGNAEANFTLHVSMRSVAIAFGNGQIAGLSAALIILIVFILLIIFFLLVRLRRLPQVETKTPNQVEVITSVSPSNNHNGKVCSSPTNAVNSVDRKDTGDMKQTNPVQKPPRLTDITYSTSHYDGNGSVVNVAQGFGSPTAGNNPDLINDTKRQESGPDMSTIGIDGSAVLPLATSGNLSCATNNLLASLSGVDGIDRPGSGEYSRAGCDSLYPSGLWETTNLNTNLLLEQANELYMNRSTSSTGSTVNNFNNYSDKMPIIESGKPSNTKINLDDETSSSDFMNRTFSRATINAQHNINNNVQNIENDLNNSMASGYPSDYGLPIVPGAEQQQHHYSKFNAIGSSNNPSTIANGGIPMNAKTLRVWQKGGVPVLPPVTALKRALTNSRNSPDEGYQEGCGTDV
ncbi:CLUMA_CG000220, isoform A [Clunio marinus]|uniref:CLUMA_CG000220, isoform A n=1 Tax=Clunio marinus TaxID=568069 RepID=A0A1J1HEI3_9DIPT|nr:CLUMA_CG000220, isoform A [Clunio marinus]